MGKFNEECVSLLLGGMLEQSNDQLHTRVRGVAEMTALGLGLSRETFTDASRYG